jgi:antitoxin ParD1/3/4
MTTVTISLPETMRQYVDSQIESGSYGNVSEYFRSLIREAQQKESERRLEQLLLQGLESEAIPITPQFWQDLKAEAAAKLAAAKLRAEHVES